MGQLTEQQRDALVENLRLELGNRLQRLRAQHELAVKALRSKIQMRINRVPKRMWHKSIREITQERTNNGSFTLSELSKVLMKPSMDDQLKVSKVRQASASKSGHSPIKVGLTKQQASPQKKPATATKNTVAKPTKATATKKTATASGKRKKNEDTTTTTKTPLTKTTASSNKVTKNTTRSVSNSSSNQRQQQPRRNLRSRAAAS